MPTILGANTLSGGYDVANSVRMNVGSGDGLQRSTETPTSQRIFTFSAWVKRSELNPSGNNMQLFAIYTDNSNRMDLRFQENDIDFYHTQSYGRITTDRKFRDVSSWYHIVLRVDTTQGTAADRYRLYVNGVQETSFSTATYPDQNTDLGTNFDTFKVGDDSYGTSHFGGYMCEVVFCDGQSLAPTSFGEFDEDTPTVWKPIDVSGLTFGNIGFYLEFKQSGTSANSSGIGADTSGNDNHFTVNNLTAVDQSTDTCTNNFCTLNPLSFTEGTLSEGNLEIDQNGSAGRFCASTFQVTQGKWYYEAKILNYGSDPRPSLGVGRNEETYTGNASQGASSIVYGLENAAVFKGNTSVFDHNSSPSSGDIYGVAFDIDNLKIYFHKNGTYFNSGDPANGTGNVTTLVSGTDYSPITGALNTSSNSARNNDWQFNFGSPPYSVSSGNSDAEGFGNFSHSVPSGFFSLCSKNLAEYG